jgi:hypothetical protein
MVDVLIDASASAFLPEKIFHRLPGFFRSMVANIEYRLWLKGNAFAPDQIRRIPASKAEGLTLLAFAYKAATGRFELRRKLLLRQKAVVFHLSHYFVLSSQKADNIRSLPNAWLAGDSDVRENTYFRNFFGWYDKPFLVLPFSVTPRFKVKRAYSDRKPLCVATGSYHDLTRESGPHLYADYVRASGHTSYHPIREVLYARRVELGDTIQVNVSPFRDYSAKKGSLRILLGHFLVSQKKYFAVDIVDLYNAHRLAVVGEELVGFPALGAFEAMACGCTLIAKEECYRGLGLRAFEHFIPYDGSLESLLKAIRNADARYETVAVNGTAFVSREFAPSSVATRWHYSLRDLDGTSA